MVDLLAPRAEDIDFGEICATLASIHRFDGAADPAVSVALHTLICLSHSGAAVAPYMLAHDMHEAFTGDISTPVGNALAALVTQAARLTVGVPAASLFWVALDTAKDRFDRAIWAAAGLAPPDSATRTEIARIDALALALERRDCMAAPDIPWDRPVAPPDTDDWAKFARAYRPRDIARRLRGHCQFLFPALRPKGPAKEAVAGTPDIPTIVLHGEAP
jgi:hypothetical protein